MAKKIIGERSLRSLTQVIKGDINKHSNPNLLDNPDFKINQRGKTEYSTGSSNEYTVDRWMTHSHTKVETLNDGIKITVVTSGAYWAALFQRLETPLTVGETYTISVYVDNMQGSNFGVSYNGTGSPMLKIGINSFTFVATDGTPNSNEHNAITFVITRDAVAEDFIHIKYVKLELGSVATPFVPPNPATELTKCMRYYQIYNCRAPYINHEPNTGCFFGGQLQVPMRITPSMKFPEFDSTTSIVGSSTTNIFIAGWTTHGGVSRALNNSSFIIHLFNSDKTTYERASYYVGSLYPIAFSADL